MADMDGKFHHYPSAEPELWRFYLDWHKADRHGASFDYANLSPRWHEAQEHLSRLWASMQWQQAQAVLKRSL